MFTYSPTLIRGGLAALSLFTLTPVRAEITLTVPVEVPVGAAFEATGEPAGVKGRLDITAADGSRLEVAASRGYIDAKRPSATLTAPLQVGKYGITFSEQGKKPVVLATFKTTPVTATVSGPEAVSIGETIIVAFTGPSYPDDKIVIGDKDGQPLKGGSYTYAGNAKDGTAKLRAPMEAGEHTILYLMSDVLLAKADIMIAGATALLIAEETVMAGGGLEVFWEGPDNSGDLITLHDATGKRRSSNAYTGNSKEGAVLLEVPEETGNYDIVYISGGKILGKVPVEVVPVSATLNAPAEVIAGFDFEVRWTGPGNRQDRILMQLPDDKEDAQPVSYAYLDPGNPVVTIQAPKTPGDHVLHYQTRAGLRLATAPLKVLPAPEKPGVLRVFPDISAGFGAGSAVEVILDASGSMLQKQDGKRRIDIARDTLVSLVSETIPPGTPFALRVFGHKQADSCRTDLEVPLTALDPQAMVSVIGKIEAKNLAKTPIAASLTAVASDLSEVPGERVVILLTDGEETCDGDPALAIRKLRADGSDVRVNIVGYAIDDEDLRQTFESWATLGNGRYLNAPSAAELAAAMKRVLSPPYKVYQGDRLVAKGIAGESKHELPAGDYTLRFQRGGETVSKAVTVAAEMVTDMKIP